MPLRVDVGSDSGEDSATQNKLKKDLQSELGLCML